MSRIKISMPYTKQQLEAQYEKLPSVLKDALFSADVAEKMFEIGKKHGLTLEKTGFAAEETGFVILGLLPPRAFATSLSKRLDITADKAQAIASDINHQIFFPLREILKTTRQIEISQGAIRSEEAAVSGRPAASAPSAPAGPALTPTPIIPVVPKQMTPPAPQSTAPVTMPPPRPAAAPTAPLPPQTPPALQRPAPTRETPPSPARPMTSAPVILEPLKPLPPMPAGIMTQWSDMKEAEKMKPPEKPKIPSPPAEPPKTEPMLLRKKLADDLQKEIAPLIGGVSAPLTSGFLTREETEKLVQEKLAAQQPPTPQKPAAPAPPSSPPPTPRPSAKPVMPPPAPAAPMMTVPAPPPPEAIKIREALIRDEQMGSRPIILEPLKSPPPAPAPASPAPPLGTAKVPPIDLRNAQPGIPKQESETKKEPVAPAPRPSVPKQYEGFDPYKEPVE